MLHLEFRGELYHWRGPSPYHFVRVPDEESAAIEDVAPLVSYGWGMVPATVHVGETSWETALWPKDGGYIVPFKDRIRRAEELELGDVLTIRLQVAAP